MDRPRPCPWVGCKHHLILHVTDAGTIRINPAPSLIVPEKIGKAWAEQRIERISDLVADYQLPTCSLDFVDQTINKDVTLEDLGVLFAITRERIRQIQEIALTEARKECERRDIDPHTVFARKIEK